MTIDRTQLSRAISHALRHVPEDYGLVLDAEGWTHLDALLAGLRRSRKEWSSLGAEDVREMIRQASKARFEIREGRIRAVYGHSTKERIVRFSSPPPELLYHGTTGEASITIVESGLRPMARHFVHLSLDIETAIAVGRRRTRSPVVLRVRAGEAHRASIPFYLAGESIWLADHVPAAYLEIVGG